MAKSELTARTDSASRGASTIKKVLIGLMTTGRIARVWSEKWGMETRTCHPELVERIMYRAGSVGWALRTCRNEEACCMGVPSSVTRRAPEPKFGLASLVRLIRITLDPVAFPEIETRSPESWYLPTETVKSGSRSDVLAPDPVQWTPAGIVLS